jgi:hypothetical protein
MKKLFYSFLCLFLLLAISNFILRHLHIREIKNKIDNIASKLADMEITLEINDPIFHGWDFWNISGTTDNIEIYTTISQSVLYFKIPQIAINSKFTGFNTILTEILFSETLDGYASLNDALAEKLKINTDYKIFLASPTKFLVNSLTKDLWGINHQTEVEFQSEALSCSVQEKSSNDKDKLFEIQNIIIESKIFDQGFKKWEFSNAIKGLDIYLPTKYLPETISIDDAKDISIKVDVKKDTTKEDKKTFNEYQGNLDIINKVFNINVSGKNINQQKKFGNTANKADLNFKIKHLQKLIDYMSNIFINVKKQENPNYDGSKSIEISNLLVKIILDNSTQERDDIVTFNIKDVEKSTLFNGKAIDEIFSPVIEKAKEM